MTLVLNKSVEVKLTEIAKSLGKSESETLDDAITALTKQLKRNNRTKKRVEIAKKFAKAIESLDIYKIILYGSVARGEDRKESDIDILVVINDKNTDSIEENISNIAWDFLLDTMEVLSPIVRTKNDYENNEDNSFFKKVNEEGVIIG